MKKLLVLLSTLAVMVGLAAAPAQAAETVSNASMFNSSLSNGTISYKTAYGAGSVFYLGIGQTRYSPYGDPIVSFKVPSGCTAAISGYGLTVNRSGGVWHSWTPSNGVRPDGTATVRVRC